MLSQCVEQLNKLPNIYAEITAIIQEEANPVAQEGKLTLFTPTGREEYVYFLKSLLNNANLTIAVAHLQSLKESFGLKPL